MSDRSTDVTVERQDDIAVVTMHRPPANYFDFALIRDLADALRELGDTGCRAAVLAAEGRHFCAGADLAGHVAALPGFKILKGFDRDQLVKLTDKFFTIDHPRSQTFEMRSIYLAIDQPYSFLL